MDHRDEPMPVYKKPGLGGKNSPREGSLNGQSMADIVALINLSSEERKVKLVSKYVNIISEFILHKAREISNGGENQEVSADDIEKVIVSEGLFFLSDIISLNKQ
ncbi:hypothetical protein [Encephalitozoon cuniculi GB-M1]|uniref:Uncharacterized protein n=2 Tax=Encephalitozoon cuniculi TaxID=6035 RepID=Q8STW0_ENCCU|nr:uncharacterized protein ECU09_0380 [Encephalitozoon cuniculi GB-M1]AGE96250.1 hypothetical protein ECU09_0380 [Encephalitozoon cuniculi]KMV65517.1 hypothetical protein M970_090380 [Encephalitozoon cuniculi EcunIII-L]UYI26716.1 hypothetical protein J0A71_03g05520 [Encephalitozoon cuniculi]CAD27009.1 hypothetical protein [Encephalitozoon cuniculi GB-M1]